MYMAIGLTLYIQFAISHVVTINIVLIVGKVRRISGIQGTPPCNVILFSEDMVKVVEIIRSLYRQILQDSWIGSMLDIWIDLL